MQGHAKQRWHIFGHTSFKRRLAIKMIEMPPAVDIFIRRLAGVQPSPESIWLIGSSANGRATNQCD
jgi:hypothetical protein